MSWRQRIPPPGFRVEIFSELPSTNDSILAAGTGDAAEGLTHIALSQTKGRGRGDHDWWSPPGAGLWMSTLLRPRLPREEWSSLALVAGVGVRNALRRLEVHADLEWPNDLVVGRRKLGGLLCEVRSDASRAWVALGIGINIDLTGDSIRRGMPPELADKCICLVESGPPTTRDQEEIASAIVTEFWSLYEDFQSGASVREIASSELYHLGHPVVVHLPNGETLRGTVSGLGTSGELLVESPNGIESVVAGDVDYLPRADDPPFGDRP
ncbi:MAG: biotin--[acetyl-CoA-carboxylase] ligase [Planctomycetota bacterium]